MLRRTCRIIFLTSLGACAHGRVSDLEPIAPLAEILVVGTDTLRLGQPLVHPAVVGTMGEGLATLRSGLPGFREVAILRRGDTLITVVLRHGEGTTFTHAARLYQARYGEPHETGDHAVAWCTATVRLQVVDRGWPNNPTDVMAVIIDRAGVGVGCARPPA